MGAVEGTEAIAEVRIVPPQCEAERGRIGRAGGHKPHGGGEGRRGFIEASMRHN